MVWLRQWFKQALQVDWHGSRLSGWSSIDEEGVLSRKSADGALFLYNVYASILELQKLCGFIVKNPEISSLKSFKELLRNSEDPSKKVNFKNF